jgi:hypothetical protein
MLTKNRRGVICDRCGLQSDEKFTYYSFDAKEVIVANNSMSFTRTPIHSFDICSRCIEELKTIIIKCYKPSRIINNTRCPQGITCDLSGVRMNNNFVCYQIIVAIVNVNVNSNPSSNVVDAEYLELWVSVDIFAQLKNRATEIKNNKENQQWSSQAIQTK